MLLNEALAIARGLGMYTLEGHITTRVEHVAALSKAPSPHSDDLSPCEEVFAAGHADANVQKKPLIALSRSMAYHAEVQHAITEMAIEPDGIGPHIKRIAQDWSDGVD